MDIKIDHTIERHRYLLDIGNRIYKGGDNLYISAPTSEIILFLNKHKCFVICGKDNELTLIFRY